jgi:predicted NBD/HSP70 family sugar kinase
MRTNKYILGIDIGGTFTKFGLIDKNWKIVKFEQIPTPPTKKAVFSLLVNKIKVYLPVINKIGIGVPGTIDRRSEKILKTPNAALSDFPLIKALKKKFNLPIKMENDANCFALAEALVGSGKKYNLVVGLTLGSGVGGGIIFNKRIYYGRRSAGELGHQFIDYKNNKDLESFIGAKKLKLNAEDYHRLAKFASAKDPDALVFWSKLGETLGYGCLNIIRFLDPEIIILGGKTAQFYNLFYQKLIKTIKNNYHHPLPKIIKSTLIDQAGIIGAGLLFK